MDRRRWVRVEALNRKEAQALLKGSEHKDVIIVLTLCLLIDVALMVGGIRFL